MKAECITYERGLLGKMSIKRVIQVGNLEEVDEENAVSLVERNGNHGGGGGGEGGNQCQKVVTVQLNHSLNVGDEVRSRLRQNPEGRINQMGITIQYLAEENVRLILTNKQLADDLERLTGELGNRSSVSDSYDPDAIFGETTEARLNRLEKHLSSERQEKWSAIENSERTRVELVNCERELRKSEETIQNLRKELDNRQTRIQDLEEAVNKLKEEGGGGGGGEGSGEAEEKPSMREFRADLRAKREARQRALSAISTELNSLREELQKEKSERRKLERELEVRTRNPSDVSLESLLSDNATLKNEIDILTENVERLKDFSTENVRLKFETRKLNEEIDSLNSTLGELKFEYYEEKRKHERTMRRLKELEEGRETVAASASEWEEEKAALFEKYDREKEETTKRTNALKEVVSITKQMLAIRENQVQELKNKLKDVEESIKKSRILEEDGLKAEYEKQLENIKKLKELYEERVRLLESENQKANDNLQEKIRTIKDQEDEIESLNKGVDSFRDQAKAERQEKEGMERELRLTIARTKDLENEISLINNMFTQMLLGPYNTGNETDLDKLTELLQENHDLIAEMTTKEDSSEIASVLPKLLLDLITQVDGMNERKYDDLPDTSDTISEQSESLLEDNQGAVLPILSYKNATLFKPSLLDEESKTDDVKQSEGSKPNEPISPAVQEIASNLPKVWKVLTELLSHHSTPEEPTPGDEKQCYKNVETPNGPRTVISVSKTFIRLKDLILEKKALQKELTRLKQLNSHLETRLDDQEKRLSQVQCELHKTWGIVGRMRAQHQQLHNHEKILRFELQEKRVMLSELKQELEFCRDKWERARQKNDESETEWKKLRREFAARKSKGYLLSSLNDSGESGFSDEQNESGEDCENFDADRSSTQSPIDQKLLEGAGETSPTCSNQVKTSSDPSQDTDLTDKIIKQSENNLKQVTESVEHTHLEECTEVKAEATGATPSVQETTSGDGVTVKEAKDLTEQAKECTQLNSAAGTSATPKVQETSQDERARAREARDLRLKRLEEQCKLLVRQVDITTHKSNYLNNRLEELHEQYGSTEDGRRQVATAEQREVATTSSQEEPSPAVASRQTDSNQTDCDDDEQSKPTSTNGPDN